MTDNQVLMVMEGWGLSRYPAMAMVRLCEVGRPLDRSELEELIPNGGGEGRGHGKRAHNWICSVRKAMGHDSVETVGAGWKASAAGRQKLRLVVNAEALPGNARPSPAPPAPAYPVAPLAGGSMNVVSWALRSMPGDRVVYARGGQPQEAMASAHKAHLDGIVFLSQRRKRDTFLYEATRISQKTALILKLVEGPQ